MPLSLTAEQKSALGVALNEASFLDASVDPSRRTALLTFEVLSWDEALDEPVYPAVTLVLEDVTRVVVSQRDGLWDDTTAAVLKLELDDLSKVVKSLGASQIYGWEFIDRDDADWDYWEQRASLDVRLQDSSADGHYIHVFKEDATADQFLELRIWFSAISIFSDTGEHIEVEDFARRGKHWWDAMYGGDSRTAAAGILPFAPAMPPEEPRGGLLERLRSLLRHT